MTGSTWCVGETWCISGVCLCGETAGLGGWLSCDLMPGKVGSGPMMNAAYRD